MLETGTTQSKDGHAHWLETAASLVVGVAFLALWFWLLPPLLGFRVDLARIGWRWIAAVPSVLGFAVALCCVWDFGHTGRGTPAPMVPPKKLVAVGLYRYVRNPMYLGFFVGWIGLWILFGRVSANAIWIAATLVIGVALFVQIYEEPHLRKLFGADYEEYCRNVPRWVPRLRPWKK